MFRILFWWYIVCRICTSLGLLYYLCYFILFLNVDSIILVKHLFNGPLFLLCCLHLIVVVWGQQFTAHDARKPNYATGSIHSDQVKLNRWLIKSVLILLVYTFVAVFYLEDLHSFNIFCQWIFTYVYQSYLRIYMAGVITTEVKDKFHLLLAIII